jgi:hypothetical protein
MIVTSSLNPGNFLVSFALSFDTILMLKLDNAEIYVFVSSPTIMNIYIC